MDPEIIKVLNSDYDILLSCHNNYRINYYLKTFSNHEIDFTISIVRKDVVISKLPKNEHLLNYLFYLLWQFCKDHKYYTNYMEGYITREFILPERKYFSETEDIKNEDDKLVNRFTHIKFEENGIIKDVITYYGNGYGKPSI